MKKIKLEIIGLSYSQSQSGAYALIIGEVGGLRRIPIIIAYSEAQSIALELEKFKTNRPLTHDLFHNFAEAFHISITEIIINKFSEGVFFSLLVCKSGDSIIEIDSRTSDAVALALRFNCPMYTYEDIIDKAGVIIDTEQNEENPEEPVDEDSKEKTDESIDHPIEIKKSSHSIQKMTLDELKEALQSAIENEYYEMASKIRDEIKKRK